MAENGLLPIERRKVHYLKVKQSHKRRRQRMLEGDKLSLRETMKRSKVTNGRNRDDCLYMRSIVTPRMMGPFVTRRDAIYRHTATPRGR